MKKYTKKGSDRNRFPRTFDLVGMTRLELATSRPPDVCATNCATSRSVNFSNANAKIYFFRDISKF